MPRNTLILITVLVLATVGLFGLAVYSLKNPPQASLKPSPIITKAPSPTLIPAPTLYFSSDALVVARGTRGKLSVMLDTHGFSVAQVQLDLAYDASVFGNVVVAPGLMDKLPLAMTSKP